MSCPLWILKHSICGLFIDSNIEYVAILQFYFILHVTGADIEIWGTSLAKLLDFQRDENQVKKDFRNLVVTLWYSKQVLTNQMVVVKRVICLLRHTIILDKRLYTDVIAWLIRMSFTFYGGF